MAREENEPGPESDGPVPGEESAPGRWAHAENPADPGLSALPGQEKRSYLVPVSIAVGIALLALVLVIAMPKGPRPPTLVLESPGLGFRAEYPSELLSGPNYVKTPAGSILTVERFSLDMAKKDWVAQLPDILFEQVLIQIQENYAYVNEIARTHPTIDGRKALEVVMEGLPAGHEPLSTITIDIVANEEWVYVLRSYSPKSRDAKERPLFAYFRDHFHMLSSSPPGKAS
jgi:hypothetical protein